MPFKKLSFLVCVILFLQSCVAALVVGGVGASVYVAGDPRSIGRQIDDKSFVIKAKGLIRENDELWINSNVEVISYNNVILLVGQVKSSDIKKLATDIVEKAGEYKDFHNQIRLGSPISLSAKSQDKVLNSKLRAKLIARADIDANKLKIIVENKEVFLLGLVDKKQAQIATKIASDLDGVRRVVRVFEYPDAK